MFRPVSRIPSPKRGLSAPRPTAQNPNGIAGIASLKPDIEFGLQIRHHTNRISVQKILSERVTITPLLLVSPEPERAKRNINLPESELLIEERTIQLLL